MEKQSKELNIFLIEDDSIDIMVFKRALKQLDVAHKLTIFTNGEEFLQYYDDNSLSDKKNVSLYGPDIMFVDLNTPRMSGIDLLKVMIDKRDRLFFPIIVLSTSAEENDISNAYKYFVNGYITKSISFNTFVENLKIVIKYWDTVQVPKGINND